MNNCLVTKLKGSVANSNLPILNAFKVALSAGTNIKAHLQCVGSNVKIYTTDGEFQYNFTPGNISYPQYTPAQDTFLVVSNKYALTEYVAIADANTIGIQKITEKLDTMKHCSNLTNLAANFTGGDLSDIADILPNLTNLILGKTNSDSEYITGDISLLSTNDKITSLQGILDYTDITGDFSTLGAKAHYVYVSTNRGRKATWKTTRNSSYPIISFVSPQTGNSYIDFGTDLDNMLINQANCSLTGTYTNKKIIVSGTRTNASDDAVATLKEKGYQIIINGSVL